MLLYELFKKCLTVKYYRIGNEVNYAIIRENGSLTLFFEASDGAVDWRRNLDFPVRPYKRMGVTVWHAHRGFLRVWHELEPILSNVIADKNIHRITTVGYSHGAAIALLCHEYIWYTRPDLRSSLDGYGFGCPRVLWGIPNSEVKRRWERFTVVRNIDDIVTHLPPAFLGYTHVGRLTEIGKRGKYSAIDAHRAENIMSELRIYESSRTAYTFQSAKKNRFGTP